MVPMRVKKEVAALQEPWVGKEGIGDLDSAFPATPALSVGERWNRWQSKGEGAGERKAAV